jgi:hypothetical protein
MDCSIQAMFPADARRFSVAPFVRSRCFSVAGHESFRLSLLRIPKATERAPPVELGGPLESKRTESPVTADAIRSGLARTIDVRACS